MVEGGTAHGWERSTNQLVCLEVPPAPVYKGGRERPALEGARQVWGVLLGLPSPSRIPLSFPEKERRKEGEMEKEKGAAPLVQFGREAGRASFLLASLSSIPVWPNKAQYFSR
mgnify:CR=1 FL=1